MPASLVLPQLGNATTVLRAFTYDDVALVQEASRDPLIPLITTVPSTDDEAAARAFIDRQHGRAVSGEGYSFAIAPAESTRAVGQVGLWLRDVQHGRATIGYWIAAPFRGRGFAAHALTLVSEWGLRQAAIHRLELHVEPRNEPSWRTAERVGYAREGLLRSWQTVGDERRDMYVYSLLRAAD